MYEIKSSVTEFDDDDGSKHYSDCKILGVRKNQLVEFVRIKDNKEVDRSDWYDVSLFKPYLRPMSSMTDEEGRHYNCLLTTGQYDKLVDWLNKEMLDYRFLIPEGLALEAPERIYNLKH